MDPENLTGDFWSAKKIENSYIINIKEKSSIKDALTDFMIHQKIKAGQIVGVGMIKDVLLRFTSPATKKHFNVKFNAKKLTANISGIVCNLNENPVLNLNVTFEKDYQSLAGHLLDARVSSKGEFIFHPLNTQIVHFNRNNEDQFLS